MLSLTELRLLKGGCRKLEEVLGFNYLSSRGFSLLDA